MAKRVLAVLGAVAATVGLQVLVNGAVFQAQNSMLVVLGSGLAVLVPWPIALLSLRWGSLSAVLAMAGAMLVLAAAGSIGLAAAYLVQYGIGSVLVPHLLKKGWRWDGAVLAGTGLSAGCGALALSVYTARLGQSPLDFADRWARGEVDRALTALKAAELPADTAQQTQKMISAIGDKLVDLYPAMTILTIAAMLLILVLFLNRHGKALLPAQAPFRTWKVTENLIWVLIGSGAGVLFLQAPWQRLGWNILVVVLAIYFLQGLAILSYFFNLKRVPPLFRALGYFLVVVSFPLRMLATGVGVFDLWIDFRKPRNLKD